MRLVQEAAGLYGSSSFDFLAPFSQQKMLLVFLDKADVLLHHLDVFGKAGPEVLEACKIELDSNYIDITNKIELTRVILHKLKIISPMVAL